MENNTANSEGSNGSSYVELEAPETILSMAERREVADLVNGAKCPNGNAVLVAMLRNGQGAAVRSTRIVRSTQYARIIRVF